MSKKSNEKNWDVFDEENKKELSSVKEQIKISSLKKKYLKIIKFLNSKNINSNDIQYKKKLYGKNNRIFYPHFVCYHKNYIKDQNNILLIALYYENDKDLVSYKKICEKYFFNFENLFFIIIFDINLDATLFYCREEGQQTYLLKIDEKYIEKFY